MNASLCFLRRWAVLALMASFCMRMGFPNFWTACLLAISGGIPLLRNSLSNISRWDESSSSTSLSILRRVRVDQSRVQALNPGGMDMGQHPLWG